MKNTLIAAVHAIALSLLSSLDYTAYAQYNNFSDTVIDGGGRTYTEKVTGSNLHNVTFQNFVFTDGGGFEFVSGSLDHVKVINNKANNIGRFISVGSAWGSNAVSSSDFEIACNEITNAAGYVFYLHQTHRANVHHNKIVGTVQGGDGGHPGVYFINRSDGDFHHNWIQNAYGNGFRVWGEGLLSFSSVNIFNCVVVGSSKYSAVEANGNYNLLPFILNINNCVFGNLSAGDYISAGLTTYNLALNTAAITNTKVFNTSAGLVSNEGGLPSSVLGSVYYATMNEAGFVNEDDIVLPDGSKWDDGGCSYERPAETVPVADAGPDQETQMPADNVTFDGSTSTSSDGGPLTYAWSQLSGAPGFSFSDPYAAIVQLKGLTAGTYQFRLTVTNAAGKSASDDVTVTVSNAEIITPVADAGEDKTISLPLSVITLDGKGSINPSGESLYYNWTQISGPPAALVTPWNSTTAVLSLSEGEYLFKLTVTAPGGQADDDTVAVTVKGILDPEIIIGSGGHFKNLSDTVIDGGGKTYENKIIGSNLKNVTFQNFVFTGQGGFEFTTGVLDGVKVINNKAYDIDRFIMVGGWVDAAVSTNFEIACNTINGASGYVFFLANSHGLNVHHNKVTNTSLGNDGPHPGVYFVNRSDGSFHHNWTESAYGNGYRIWGEGLSGRTSIYIYNSVVIGSKKYSAVEANGNYSNSPFDLVVDNCVFGNLDPDDYISAGMVLYPLGENTASILNSTVFNTSAGIFSNEGASPASVEGSQYFNSLEEAGFSDINNITLPDGTKWSDEGCDQSEQTGMRSINNPPAQDSISVDKKTVSPLASKGNNTSLQLPVPGKTSASIKIYPNPATDNINIRLNNERTGPVSARIYDVNGKLQLVQQFQKTTVFFSGSLLLQKLSAGIYVVDISINGISIAREKILKH